MGSAFILESKTLRGSRCALVDWHDKVLNVYYIHARNVRPVKLKSVHGMLPAGIAGHIVQTLECIAFRVNDPEAIPMARCLNVVLVGILVAG